MQNLQDTARVKPLFAICRSTHMMPNGLQIRLGATTPCDPTDIGITISPIVTTSCSELRINAVIVIESNHCTEAHSAVPVKKTVYEDVNIRLC